MWDHLALLGPRRWSAHPRLERVCSLSVCLLFRLSRFVPDFNVSGKTAEPKMAFNFAHLLSAACGGAARRLRALRARFFSLFLSFSQCNFTKKMPFLCPCCSQRPRPRSLRPWLVLLVRGATWLPRERPNSSTSSDDGASKSAFGGYRGVEPAVAVTCGSTTPRRLCL